MGKAERRYKQIYKEAKQSFDRHFEYIGKESELAENIAQKIRAGEQVVLNFSTLSFVKLLNSATADVEPGELSLEQRQRVARVVRHVLLYPQDFQQITFSSIGMMHEFFRLYPLGEVGVAGLIDSAPHSDVEINDRATAQAERVTKKIDSVPTNPMADRDEVETEKSIIGQIDLPKTDDVLSIKQSKDISDSDEQKAA